MSFWPGRYRNIGEARAALPARLHPSHLKLVEALDAVADQGSEDPARACLQAARRFSADDLERLNDAPALLVQARDIETFRAWAAAPEPVPNAPDARWWEQQIQAARRQAPRMAAARDVQARSARHASALLGLPVNVLLRSERHHESLLGLPVLLGERSPRAIAAWVDTTLADIDPSMAAELRADDPVLRALLQDREDMLVCMSYLSMMLEAVPASVYAYMAGPGAVHVPLQIVRLLACAFLGARSALGPIHGWVERLQAPGPGEAQYGLLDTAVKELALHLDQFTTAVGELHRLGEMLLPGAPGWGGRLGKGLRGLFGS